MSGVERIAAERQRQVDVEGWTPGHDADEHGACELTQAASAYAYYAVGQVNGECWPEDEPAIPPSWPWHMDWWKPSTHPIRNLEKAGALIAAEIDRLERQAEGVIECYLCSAIALPDSDYCAEHHLVDRDTA